MYEMFTKTLLTHAMHKLFLREIHNFVTGNRIHLRRTARQSFQACVY